MFLKSNLIDRIKLPFRKDRELYASFFDILGFYPRDIRFYKLALMHKSSAGRSRDGAVMHNERLEFLGDAVLESIVSDILYHRFHQKREGFLTDTRSKLVQRETLNQLAKVTGLERLIHSNSRSTTHNNYMGGNAFEALVGAIYLDRGYQACMCFMRERILDHLINVDSLARKEVNFKSKLIEWSQKYRMKLEFRLVAEKRENGSTPVFITRIIIEGIEGETGQGYSKKESHQQAARSTLRRLKTDKLFVHTIFEEKERRMTCEAEPADGAGEAS